MHILFLTDNFPPEVNAPASRTYEHCSEWVRAGHQVTVITCFPNFPHGKIFAGYKNGLIATEEIDGIRVIRVWTWMSANRGKLRRTLDYLSFFPCAVVASCFAKRPDIVIGTSPQFFAVCAAWVISLFKGAPFVFELRDLWPASISTLGAIGDGVMIGMLKKIENFLYRRAALIVSVTNSFKSILIDRGITPEKIAVIKNGVDPKRFSPKAKSAQLARKLNLEGKFAVGYIGTLGMAHNLETLLYAAERLQFEQKNARFIFIGAGAEKEKLVQTARLLKLNNVQFIDTVSREKIVDYWALLDVAIIHLKNKPLFESVIPSKLFEAMAMGVPVLHGVKGESARIVEETNCGLLFEPEDADELAEKIIFLSENNKRRKQLSVCGLHAAKSNERQARAKQMQIHIEQLYEPSTNFSVQKKTPAQ